jgi:hypothetical protein
VIAKNPSPQNSGFFVYAPSLQRTHSNLAVFARLWADKLRPYHGSNFLEHACFLVACDKTNLLFDAYISHNSLAKTVGLDASKADYISLLYGHCDHEKDAEQVGCNRSLPLSLPTLK